MELSKHLIVLFFALVYSITLIWAANRFFLDVYFRKRGYEEESQLDKASYFKLLVINLNILIYFHLCLELFITYLDYQSSQGWNYFKLFTFSSLHFIIGAICLLASFYVIKLIFGNKRTVITSINLGMWLALHTVLVYFIKDLFQLLTSHHAFSIY